VGGLSTSYPSLARAIVPLNQQRSEVYLPPAAAALPTGGTLQLRPDHHDSRRMLYSLTKKYEWTAMVAMEAMPAR
jgi:hypothetical protein